MNKAKSVIKLLKSCKIVWVIDWISFDQFDNHLGRKAWPQSSAQKMFKTRQRGRSIDDLCSWCWDVDLRSAKVWLPWKDTFQRLVSHSYNRTVGTCLPPLNLGILSEVGPRNGHATHFQVAEGIVSHLSQCLTKPAAPTVHCEAYM